MAELIDRQAALKSMCETCRYCEKLQNRMRETHPDFVKDKCNMYKFIAEQPTIEPEVRHGRWIEETEPDENGNVIAMCNQCYHTDEHCKNIKIPYCWYCGARMDGGADNG